MSKRRLNVEDPDFLDYMAATPPAAEISSDESDDDGFMNEILAKMLAGVTMTILEASWKWQLMMTK